MKDSDLLAFHYARSISFLLNTVTLGRDVSLYQVISLLFNKLSSCITNITREIPYPELFPREGGKSICIEKTALKHHIEFISSFALFILTNSRFSVGIKEFRSFDFTSLAQQRIWPTVLTL